MKKIVFAISLGCALTGCGSGSSINCDTPEVKQTELQLLAGFDSLQLEIESTTQFTDRQTGKITCNVQYSYFNSDDKKREMFLQEMVFELKVADDHEHFYVTLQ